MQHTLSFELFGTPSVKFDGKAMIFSFSKINALLYYLAINKTIRRDEIAGMLWPNKGEKSAKKNLRNTIYQANHMMEEELIVSPNKSILTFNEALTIDCDVYRFENDPYDGIKEYQDEFLKGFYLKDSELFDSWVSRMRILYEQQFIEHCYQKVAEDISLNAVSDVEKNIRKLISIDEFDERNYQLLMRFYQANQRQGKAIETYYELSQILKTELGIEPSEETKKVYQDTLNQVKHQKGTEKSQNVYHFYDRSNEIEEFELQLASLKQNETCQSILVKGDMGVGKTALCELVLNNVHFSHFLLKTTCYKAEETYSLRPFREILQQIMTTLNDDSLEKADSWKETMKNYFPFFSRLEEGNLKEVLDEDGINLLGQAVLETVYHLSEEKPVIIFIENLQWMDNASFKLLTSLMLHNTKHPILFILTMQTSWRQAGNDFLASTRHYDKLLTLDLKPLQKFEIRGFCEKQLADFSFDNETLDYIYEESQGIPFYMNEYLQQLQCKNEMTVLTSKMEDQLSLQFVYLSALELELAELISFFQEVAPLSILVSLVNKKKTEIMKALDKLSRQGLIVEDIYLDEVCFSYTHKKYKQYIYQQQTPMKLRMIHEKIAILLEEKLKDGVNDNEILGFIGYHYRHAHQELKSLDYELSHHQVFLRVQHELFPISHKAHLLSKEEVKESNQHELEKFTEIGSRLKEIEEQYQHDATYQLLLVKYLYLEGRYLINYGHYQKGIENIQRVIGKSKDFHLTEYLLRGYRQMIYYYIQTDNAVDMGHYIDLAMDVAVTGNNNEAIGILLRLKGLYYLMIGDFIEAESLFKESITIFNIANRFSEKYNSNIAAAYDYLAEIERLKGNYQQSIRLEQKAINLCENDNLMTSLGIFYVDMGITLYAEKEFDKAEEYFLKAKELFEVTSSVWKRTQLNGYLALIYLHKKDYGKVVTFIEKTNGYKNQLANPRDNGIVYFIKALAKEKCITEHIENPQLNSLLTEDLDYYQGKAMESLSKSRDHYEIKVLEELALVSGI